MENELTLIPAEKEMKKSVVLEKCFTSTSFILLLKIATVKTILQVGQTLL